MKKSLSLILTALTLISCTSAVRSDYLEKGTVNFSSPALTSDPETYKGRLFVFGGIIVSTKVTEKGSLIEGIYLPVDSQGTPKTERPKDGRFLAFYPKEAGILDPVLYRPRKEVTIAGEFTEVRQGKIDEMQYSYPVFEIRDIRLWEERNSIIVPPPYPSWYYPAPYWWYDPWWGYPYQPFRHGPHRR
ncbi:MAG: Slp family lipoprotein [Thermodesulfovibrionales bacterium]|jgi:outer membrane lipoprotein